MTVDLFDFDKTIVPYDSAMKYWYYCLFHYPYLLIILPYQIFWSLLALMRIIPVEEYKKHCFRFVSLLNTEKSVKKFWDKHEKDVYPFWNELKCDGVKRIIVSASPKFLIEEIANRIGADYIIATNHDVKNGFLIGNVVRREEKVRKIKEELPDITVLRSYSDSLTHDKPLLALGKERYLLKKGEISRIDDAIFD